METGNTEIFKQLTGNLVNWLKSEFVSLVYYPSADDTNYFLLLILDSKHTRYDIRFWIEYYQQIESHWDFYWTNRQPEGKVPLLSITLRSKDSCKDNQLISLSPEDTYTILYDTEDFYKNTHAKIVVQSNEGNFNPDGDILWI
jgi:hypothetical protein